MFQRFGLMLDALVVQNISLPEELQKMLDTRIGMNMIGDMGRYTQYQVANSIPLAAQNEGGLAGIGAGVGAGLSHRPDHGAGHDPGDAAGRRTACCVRSRTVGCACRGTAVGRRGRWRCWRSCTA